MFVCSYLYLYFCWGVFLVCFVRACVWVFDLGDFWLACVFLVVFVFGFLCVSVCVRSLVFGLELMLCWRGCFFFSLIRGLFWSERRCECACVYVRVCVSGLEVGLLIVLGVKLLSFFGWGRFFVFELVFWF